MFFAVFYIKIVFLLLFSITNPCFCMEQDIDFSTLQSSSINKGTHTITKECDSMKALYNPYKWLFSSGSVARNNFINSRDKFFNILIDIAKNNDSDIRQTLTKDWIKRMQASPSFATFFMFYTSIAFLIICPVQTVIILKLYKKLR